MIIPSTAHNRPTAWGFLVALALAAFVTIFVPLWVALGGFVLAAAVMTYLIVKSSARGWDPPELELSSEFLELGSSVSIVYRRRLRNSTVPVGKAEFTLVCEERLRTTKNGEPYSRESRPVEQQFSATGEGNLDCFEATTTLSIPCDAGGPTVDIGMFIINWYLLVALKGSGLPADTRRFDLHVEPSIALDFVNKQVS